MLISLATAVLLCADNINQALQLNKGSGLVQEVKVVGAVSVEVLRERLQELQARQEGRDQLLGQCR